MPLVDEEGDLFGLVNAVDALAVLLVAAAVAAGGAVLLAGADADTDDEPDILTQTVRVQADDGTLAGLETGPVENPQVAEVTDVADGSVTLRLVVNTTDEGLVTFGGERLFIGRTLSVQLGDADVSGVVVEAFEPVGVSAVPTPTPTPTATPTGTATITGTETATQTPHETRVVTVEATVDEITASELVEGSVPAAEVVAVQDVERRSVDDGVRVVLQLELAVTTADGAVYFRGVELTEGLGLRLDLDPEVTVTVIGR